MANLSHKTHDVTIADLKAGDLTVALLMGPANPDGSGVSEPSPVNGYARQPITFGETERQGAASVIKNTNAIVFGPANPQGWATVSHLGLFDADGDLRAVSALGTPRFAPLGDAISFAIGAVQFKFF